MIDGYRAVKLHALTTVSLPVSAEDRANMVRAAWRFGYGLMQPKSKQSNLLIACDCTSPEVLLADCPWHGNEAQRMCFGK